MRRILTTLFIIVLLFGLGGVLLGDMAHAQSGGLVPCGDTKACDLCDLYVLVKNIIDFILFKFILPVAVISLLIGGILLLTSRGNPGQLETGKAALYNTIIGILIAFAAWVIISTLLSTIGFKNFGGGLPWNDFPTCQARIVPAFTGGGGGGGGAEACDPTATPTRACTTTSGGAGTQACLNGIWDTACFEICTENLGDTQACNFMGCGPASGSQVCTENATYGKVWTTCQDNNPGDNCPAAGGGTCSPVSIGPCSVSALSSPSSCFASVANQASQICGAESAGNPTRESTVDRATGGGCPAPYPPNNCPFSIGLFQINIAVHSVAGLNCPSAFQLSGGKYVIVNQSLYTSCVVAAKNAKSNIKAACQVYAEAGNTWKDWSTAGDCNLL
ncbi:MAG: hypothetical protein COU90_01555 [Candidatus Ryanbacteria bacterium CG10_big_fil_rev_8_21_14_0_10_43_42]|uniref:Transglycosylase SLT domain-containing protein n=1 Tax=Candidatus Ryanbacteria bacterium CG10_big_fil_rev_8_21_14_0_10_43_42 TaxID=1974864 RepID=A0A2M8KX60_9BACT|nr:MAG: hypothetical protein COU90_01555 [Candidatus Ryanbacteria bacterium CG10_big_fil_rev_8_21_14_0_10_43_42]